MDEQQLKTIIRERCGFSTFPQDHMVDPIILRDIASREGVSLSLVQEAYRAVRLEREQELQQELAEFMSSYSD